MNITASPVKLSATVISFEEIDIDNFEDEFKPYLQQNKQLLLAPLYFQHTENTQLSIPEIAILFDSLKDLGIHIAGTISKDKAIRRFSEYLGTPSFESTESIGSADGASITFESHAPSPSSIPISTPLASQTRQQMTEAQALNNSTKATPPLAQSSAETEWTNNYSKLEKPMDQTISLSQEDKKSLTAQDPHEERYRQQQNKSIYRPVNDSKNTDQTDPPSEPSKQQNKPDPASMISPHLPSPDQINRAAHTKNEIKSGGLPLVIKEVVGANKKIKHQGDIILLEASEKGSVISATGSVYCHQPANGTILVGSSGNTTSKIYAKNLNCEAVAIAGCYAKHFQYSQLLNNPTPIMISLKDGNLNFSAIKHMPVLREKRASQTQTPQDDSFYFKKTPPKDDEVANPAYKQTANKLPSPVEKPSLPPAYAPPNPTTNLPHAQTDMQNQRILSSLKDIQETGMLANEINKEEFNGNKIVPPLSFVK